MTKDEALKMAIEALAEYPVMTGKLRGALQACKEALEQPAQEPYCWLGYGMQAHDEKPFEGATPLYKHPAPTIKESLMVEPAQEPVAWTKQSELDKTTTLRNPIVMWKNQYTSIENNVPLYTHPAPSWQGLSDDEIRMLEDIHKVQGTVCGVGVKTFARAIEQALKEKNHDFIQTI